MPNTECCVPRCKEKGGHVFPVKPSVRAAWVVAVKRQHPGPDKGKLWQPTRHSVVCRSHFTAEDYIGETFYGGKPCCKRLKAIAVPSVFVWSKEQSAAALKRKDRLTKRSAVHSLPKLEGMQDTAHEQSCMDVGAECDIVSEAPLISSVTDISSQTNISGCPTVSDATTEPMSRATLSVENFKFSPKAIHHFTGLEHYDKFTFVLSTLGPAASQLSYMYGPVPDHFTVEDLFFLVLIKLRKHSTNFELSIMFGISEAHVYNICCTWVRFMALQWREISFWPPQDFVRFYAPTGFQDDFPSTRVIVDGTECPIKKPKLPSAQQSTFSTYKNRNTVKVLIGVSPAGMCTYVSSAYGGSTSDRQIVERSTLPEVCDPGDSVMSDKGFDVHVTVNIPTFFRKKNRMSGETVMKDRKIASKRVHVERFIGLVKTYKILTAPLNTSETQLSSDIIFVCCFLCNFRAGIVPRYA